MQLLLDPARDLPARYFARGPGAGCGAHRHVVSVVVECLVRAFDQPAAANDLPRPGVVDQGGVPVCDDDGLRFSLNYN